MSSSDRPRSAPLSYVTRGQAGEPLRVLAIEGGGLRGIYQATYLERVRELAVRNGVESARADPGRVFDLIVGTSTGGLIACALAAGIDLGQVRALYRTHGAKIFPRQWLRALPGFGRAYRGLARGAAAGDVRLRAELEALFGERTLWSVFTEHGRALAIPAINMSRHAPTVFKTPHLNRLHGRDDQRTLVDVCLATTAAPVVRRMAWIPDGQGVHSAYVDGGLWANNPVLAALVEAWDLVEQEPEPARAVHLFVLGNAAAPGGENVVERGLVRGIWGWNLGLRIVETSAQAQSGAYDYLAGRLAKLRGDGTLVCRLPDTALSSDMLGLTFGMDDARPKILDELVRRAQLDVDEAWRRRDSDTAIRAFFASFGLH